MTNFIGLNIKYLCDKNKLSQKEFGEIFGVGQAVINTYIKGRSNPQVETMQKICAHFNITLDDFINSELSLQKSTSKLLPQTREPSESYGKDFIIKTQQETIEVQKELIKNLQGRVRDVS